MLFYSSQKMHSLLIKHFFLPKKWKTPFQMTHTIEKVRPRQVFEPGFGVAPYLVLGARLFSTQWPLYGAHTAQGLLGLYGTGVYRRLLVGDRIPKIIIH